MERLLRAALSQLVTRGNLRVTLPDGRSFTFGDDTGNPVAIRFADAKAVLGFLTDPEMQLGELFMNRRLIVEQGTIYDFLALVLAGARGQPAAWWERGLDRARFLLRHVTTRNTRDRSRDNVARHYDLDDRLYALFLDEDWQYSCAYFEQPDQSLDDAQLAKKRHIVAKLLVEPHHRVLDIGCGWGGMCLYLTETAKVREAFGVTLSTEQLEVAQRRAAERGASERARFALQDYRDVTGTFDRIVSVGMFEHIGPRFFSGYFETCHRLLDENGVILLHTIGCSDGPNHPNPWLNRYIFPGGYLPSLSEMMPAIEKAGLVVTDVEILRLHYAKTLQHWRERFMARRDEALALYDERFCLMWEFYLAMSQTAFEYQDVAVFQVQLVKRQEAVPLTRDYIAQREARLREAESETALRVAERG
ncbi:cyclopropane-fatty-acyl-phospholipid synthase family protein [Bosea sp. (in: a-proteobacteria)]|uniref:SAM-dependent methyltransferase n=1 Tax=Bosea sp. (in: a-proteobacteria) TaxID=1871050 RepID=UPI001202C0EE|nr:cyclopropane-fatty-acyl-phospholipid synthase family protein [Bosea sp. (in: a-proteobacteria)]TAJ30134.1 MAG: class I SAM-dependent methyltransferase [Bosea sp. (in: a-proteobacteria)]